MIDIFKAREVGKDIVIDENILDSDDETLAALEGEEIENEEENELAHFMAFTF